MSPDASKPAGGADGEFGSEDPDEPDGGVPRGWVPPEARTWRHPSELSSLPFGGGLTCGSAVGEAEVDRSSGGRARAVSSRRRTTAMALVGTGAAAAAIAGMVLLNSGVSDGNVEPVGDGPPVTAGVLTTWPNGSAASSSLAPASARTLEGAVVALEVTTPSRARLCAGVAVSSDGMVATAASALVGATGVEATSVNGWSTRATIVAVDRRTNVALLRIDRGLRVPHFVDDVNLGTGRAEMVMAAGPKARNGRPQTAWRPAVVESVGTAAVLVGSNAMAGIGVSGSALPQTPGELLVDSEGDVTGMFGSGVAPTQTVRDTTMGFLPAQLLVGVSRELERWGRVRHGWLDISARDATGTGPSPTLGATVSEVDSHGAAHGLLERGDVIQRVAGAPVRSAAELAERLYLLHGGHVVQVEVRRMGQPVDVDVRLRSSP